MDNNIENIFSKQAKVLPAEVREFVVSAPWDAELDAIVTHYGLSPDDADVLRTETALTLAGLTHPDEFRKALAEQFVGADTTTIDATAADVAMNIFAPVRPALLRFLDEQDDAEAQQVASEKSKAESATPSSPQIPPLEGEGVEAQAPLPQGEEIAQSARVWEKVPEVVPDNLPTGEGTVNSQQSIVNSENGAPLMPPLKQKLRPSDEIGEVVSQQSIVNSEDVHPFEEKMKKVFTGGVADMAALEIPPTTPSSSAHDPYREPIE